ncbi:hypothetical protein [Spirillospora sp. NBC_01491]|nr:hypothetical protein [Spirillospora sp. NBC_01491]
MGNLLAECGGRARGLAGQCARVFRAAGDRGSAFGEYLGVLLLVVAITTAVVTTGAGSIGEKFKNGIGGAVDKIVNSGGDKPAPAESGSATPKPSPSSTN